ncbi:unnamed protein product, partial [Polarella glacialis]
MPVLETPRAATVSPRNVTGKGCAESVCIDELQAFPVPIVLAPAAPSEASDVKLFLKVRARWSRTAQQHVGPCIAVVERPEDCVSAAFPDGTECPASVLWNISRPDEFLGFQLPRPSFTLGSEASQNHSVCLHLGGEGGNATSLQPPRLLGRLEYYPMPKPVFTDRVESISVRTFLNPGWRHQIHLTCVNCSAMSHLAVRPPPPSRIHCKEPSSSLAAAILALSQEPPPLGVPSRAPGRARDLAFSCPPSAHGPCWGYADQEILSLARVTDFPAGGSDEAHVEGSDAVAFLLESDVRLGAWERQELFHRRSALCFYPDLAAPQGWLVGYVDFHMDSLDVQAFMSFVCFFGMALPLLCMLT